MKKICKTVLLPCLLYIASTVATAQPQVGGGFADSPPYPPGPSPQRSPNMENLVKYLLNLGSYLGYNLKQAPQGSPQAGLIDPSKAALQASIVHAFLGAIPVGVFQGSPVNIFPSFIPDAQALNQLFANHTFSKPQPYSTPSKEEISVNALLDQQTYQIEPVNQSLLNILTTPDSSFCIDNGKMKPDCLGQNKVANNVFGIMPSFDSFFNYKYNNKIIDQLNSNTLLAPLLYSTTFATLTTASPQPEDDKKPPGLIATNQKEQAANFIRYATGLVVPIQLPTQQALSAIYKKAAKEPKTDQDRLAQDQAKATIASYFNNLRVYAAQTSVGISNLYYILSKRMPQTYGTADPTSQALSEFNMATRRIFKTPQENEGWIAKINQASSTTVQKEMAVLLAEINYQLYLNRQQNERLLLTNSILLLQQSKAGQPVPQFDTGAAD